MHWLQSGGLLQLGGLLVLGYAVYHIVSERRARHIQRLIDEARIERTTTEQTIRDHVRDSRKGV